MRCRPLIIVTSLAVLSFGDNAMAHPSLLGPMVRAVHLTAQKSRGAQSRSAETPSTAIEPAPAPAAPAPPKKKTTRRIRPCNTPDEGFGIYDGWDSSISMGQVIIPKTGGITKDGGFDLIVHFHGHEPIRKEFAPVGGGIVLVGIDLGVRSLPYLNAFSSEDAFPQLLASVQRAVAAKRKRKRVYVRRIGLSSWSAGYGAIDQILRQPIAASVDTVILLDSLYGSFTDSSHKEIKQTPLEPFLNFARDAMRGRRFLYQTHSSVQTYGYANTRQVSHFMVKLLGGKLSNTSRKDRLNLELFERFDHRSYRVRGYKGNDKPAHCGHIGIVRDVVKTYLLRRWKTPRAG